MPLVQEDLTTRVLQVPLAQQALIGAGAAFILRKQMQLAIASSFIGTLVRHMEQTFGFAVSAMANKAILSGVEYLSAYAAALGEDA